MNPDARADRGVTSATGFAPPVQPLGPDDPPLAILVDYDGTIALTDVSDTVMAEHVPAIWESEAAAYDAGLMGSRRLMEIEMALVDAPGEALLATAAAQPHDPDSSRSSGGPRRQAWWSKWSPTGSASSSVRHSRPWAWASCRS